MTPAPSPGYSCLYLTHSTVPTMVVERSRTGIQSIFEETSESESSFTDSSSTLFSIYLSHAVKHDRDQAEGWKAGADGILVFVRSLTSCR